MKIEGIQAIATDVLQKIFSSIFAVTYFQKKEMTEPQVIYNPINTCPLRQSGLRQCLPLILDNTKR